MSSTTRPTVASRQNNIENLDESSTLPEPHHQPDLALEQTTRIEELDDDDSQENLISDEDAAYMFPKNVQVASEESSPIVPELFTALPPIRDVLTTETSTAQDCTIQECLPFLAGTNDFASGLDAHGVPRLERRKHVEFLHSSLQRLPAGYVGYDASRPWVVYWALTGLCLLGEDISDYRDRYLALVPVCTDIDYFFPMCGQGGRHESIPELTQRNNRVVQTFIPMQNPDGGFGSGHGQMSHCASSYATILSLAMVGGAEALDLIDRRSLWRWLGDLKQPDGGFAVCLGGEEDVRGAYCAMVMIALLHLPLDLPPAAPAKQTGMTLFTSGLPEYISRCQTFEGGMSGAPGTEAHGAYAFCALACLCTLGAPHEVLPTYLDLPLLVSWLSARQYAPEGGFAGRTNKLVDGCYSFWVGGCWPLIEAALNGPITNAQAATSRISSLYSREGLLRYILCCCQSSRGGLRDKPSKHVDGYHSCYVLAGLSSAQYHHYLTSLDSGRAKEPLEFAFRWAYSGDLRGTGEQGEHHILNKEDRLMPLHPIFVIPPAAVDRTDRWFLSKTTF